MTIIELSETAMRILAELEEARAENVSSTMNTILDAKGASSEISEIEASLSELVRADLAQIAYADPETGRLSSASKEQSLTDIRQLSQRMSFRVADQLWVWDKSFPRAQVRVTNIGLAQARQILERRGYQWWK